MSTISLNPSLVNSSILGSGSSKAKETPIQVIMPTAKEETRKVNNKSFSENLEALETAMQKEEVSAITLKNKAKVEKAINKIYSKAKKARFKKPENFEARKKYLLDSINEKNSELAKKIFETIEYYNSDYTVEIDKQLDFYLSTVPKILRAENPEVQSLAKKILINKKMCEYDKKRALEALTTHNLETVKASYYSDAKIEEMSSTLISKIKPHYSHSIDEGKHYYTFYDENCNQLKNLAMTESIPKSEIWETYLKIEDGTYKPDSSVIAEYTPYLPTKIKTIFHRVIDKLTPKK